MAPAQTSRQGFRKRLPRTGEGDALDLEVRARPDQELRSRMAVWKLLQAQDSPWHRVGQTDGHVYLGGTVIVGGTSGANLPTKPAELKKKTPICPAGCTLLLSWIVKV